MSPWLYSLFINGLLKKLKAEKLGVAFVGEWIGALAFADDIVLIAESAEEMARMVRVCEEYARRWRFEFNVKKCKYMIIDGDAMEEAIQIEGNEVERVNNFKYLGVWLSVWGGVGGNGKEQGRERQEQAGAVEGNVGIRKRQMDNGREEDNVGGDRENSNGVRDRGLGRRKQTVRAGAGGSGASNTWCSKRSDEQLHSRRVRMGRGRR